MPEQHQGTFSEPYYPGDGIPYGPTIQQRRDAQREAEGPKIWQAPGPQLMLTNRELRATPQEQQMALAMSAYRSSHRDRAHSLPPGSARPANFGVVAYPSPGPDFDARRMGTGMEPSDVLPPAPPGYGWHLEVSYDRPPPYSSSTPVAAPFISAHQRSGSMQVPSPSRRSSVGAPTLGPAPSFSSPQRASSVHDPNPGPHVSRHTSGAPSPAMSLPRPTALPRPVAPASGYSSHINRSQRPQLAASSPVTAGSPRSASIRSPTRSSYPHPLTQATSMLDESRQTSSPEPDSDDDDDDARSTSFRRSLPPTTPQDSLLFGTLTLSSPVSGEIHQERPKKTRKLQKKSRTKEML